MLAFATFLLAVAAIALRATRRALTTDEVTIPLVVLSVLAVHVVTTFFMTPETSTSALFWVIVGAGLAAIDRRRLAPIPSVT